MQPRTFSVASTGLARIAPDIEALLGLKYIPRGVPFRKSDAIVGWGNRPSGQSARTIAKKDGIKAILLEDGFVKGFRSDLNEPPHSYVVDYKGIYFDTSRPSTFLDCVEGSCSIPELTRARNLMDFLRAEQVTKFNAMPRSGTYKNGLPRERPFIVLVDQVHGDASISGAGVGKDVFRKLAAVAADFSDGRAIVIRAHPQQTATGPLISAARELRLDFIVPEAMNPWSVIEEADAVFTVSSHLGFEAIIAGKAVHCFGNAWYSGRGLTVDHVNDQQPKAAKTVEELFFALYCQYSTWLDVHDRSRITPERAIDQVLTIRNQRLRFKGPIHTAGFSPWKRKATAPFLVTAAGKAKHHIFQNAAARASKKDGGVVAAWGSNSGSLHIEDGFIRSQGLGASLVYPSSLCLDLQSAYYDARTVSDLEAKLMDFVLAPEQMLRARALRALITDAGVTKYNLLEEFELPTPAGSVLRVLVPGQVEMDNSVRFGSSAVKSNHALVDAVRKLFPDAFIAYKPHPDVLAGFRSGGLPPSSQDYTAKGGNITAWFEWCDRVETMTSLSGFEALLRGLPVGVHGQPFYAGWGLTDDRNPLSRRNQKLTLDALVAASLIEYPLYIHPNSRLPCEVEELVTSISTTKTKPDNFKAVSVSGLLNRLAITLRDVRRRRFGE